MERWCVHAAEIGGREAEEIAARSGACGMARTAKAHGAFTSCSVVLALIVGIEEEEIEVRSGRSDTRSTEQDHAVFARLCDEMAFMVLRADADRDCRSGTNSQLSGAHAHDVLAKFCPLNADIVRIDADASAVRHGWSMNLRRDNDHDRSARPGGSAVLRRREEAAIAARSGPCDNARGDTDQDVLEMF